MTRLRFAARRAREHHDSGFTLIEVVTTVVIMGLVIVPLTGALIQAMRVIPQDGDRAQTATDTSALVTTFADDVAQAQTYSDLANGTTPFDSSTTTWTSAAPDVKSVSCPSTTSTVDLMGFSWTDQGVTSSPTQSQPKYSAVFTALGGTRVQWQLVREDRLLTGSSQVMARAYCTAGASGGVFTMLSLATTTASPRYGLYFLIGSSSDSTGTALPVQTLYATVRAG